jgi:GTP-binding protein
VLLATVAIVGRPNVGKSTLFNRLLGQHVAIVNATSGVTRDRHYGTAEWLGHSFRVIDTGGIVTEKPDGLLRAILAQAECALAEADLIFFVVDARDGVTATDQEIALRLHKTGKTVLVVVNKVETAALHTAEPALYRLGFGEPFFISAEHGRGVGDLLDALLLELPKVAGTKQEETSVQVALVGRPNVGKSSLVNHILGEDRLIVDAAPGTTRDAIDSLVKVNKKLYTLVDTAGMRKPRRIGESLEKATVAVSLKRIQRCEVAVLMLDAAVSIGEQDIRIGTYIERQGKACVIAINKWDVIEKATRTYETFVHTVREAMPFLAHAPIISLSACTGQRVVKLFPLIDAVVEEAKRRIPVAALQKFLKDVTSRHPVPAHRGQSVKLSFIVQTSVQPPTFLCFVNRPAGVAHHYQRFLQHQLRQRFGFAGTPIRFRFRKK